MTSMPHRRPQGIRHLFVVFLALAVWAAFVIFKRHQMEPIHRQLENEFSKIQPPPDSALLKHESTRGTQTVLVQSSYKTSLTSSKVKAHYELELQRNGWSVRDEHFLPRAGAWSNVDEVIFCKGSYGASLGYTDAVPRSSFWFNVNWGLSGCK
jgi:hypothetical protein